MSGTAGAHGLIVGFSTVFGLLIGSFLNVVVYRVPRRLSVVHPPSHCPACEVPISQRDNVPVVSWILLAGRCRHCRSRISLRYPAIEAGTAAAFCLSAIFVPSLAGLVPVLVVVGAGLAASAIDADRLRVPRALAAASCLGAVGLAAAGLAQGHPGRLAWAAAGGGLTVVGALVLDLLAAATQRRQAESDLHQWLDVRRAVLVGTLGWTAGWFWLAGGVLAAIWVVIATLPFALGLLARRPPAPDHGTEGHAPEPLIDAGAPVGALALGVLGLMLAGAALH